MGLHAPHATRSSDSARGLCRKLAQSPYERGDEAGPEIVGCLDRRDRNGVPAYGHACARPGRWRWCRTSRPQISDRLAEVLRDDLIVAEFPQGFCDRPAETKPSPSEERLTLVGWRQMSKRIRLGVRRRGILLDTGVGNVIDEQPAVARPILFPTLDEDTLCRVDLTPQRSRVRCLRSRHAASASHRFGAVADGPDTVKWKVFQESGGSARRAADKAPLPLTTAFGWHWLRSSR